MTHLTPEIKKELIEFLKENLSISISEKTRTVDRSYGDYCDKTDFKVTLLIGDDIISEDYIYTYGS